jgi:hypothetical protein
MEPRSDGRFHSRPSYLLVNVLEAKGIAESIGRELRQAVESSVEVILEAPTAGNSSGVECSCHITLVRVNSIQSISNATFSKVLYFLPRKASLGKGGPKACRPQISKRGIMGLVHLMIMEPSSGYSVRSLNLISLNVINTNAPLPCCCCHTPSSCSLKELSWSVYLASLTSLLRSLVPLNGESQLPIFHPLSLRLSQGSNF